MYLNILAWIIIGGLTGWVYVRKLRLKNMPNHLILATSFAIIGGCLFFLLTQDNPDIFNGWSIFQAFILAVCGMGVIQVFSLQRTY